jgi:hypothetical protein
MQLSPAIIIRLKKSGRSPHPSFPYNCRIKQ